MPHNVCYYYCCLHRFMYIKPWGKEWSYLKCLVNESSPVAQTVKRLPAVRETRVRSMGWEDSLEKEIATTPGLLPGRFHALRGSSEPGRLQSMGSQRAGHDWVNELLMTVKVIFQVNKNAIHNFFFRYLLFSIHF